MLEVAFGPQVVAFQGQFSSRDSLPHGPRMERDGLLQGVLLSATNQGEE
jgi:hypothetical protein